MKTVGITIIVVLAVLNFGSFFLGEGDTVNLAVGVVGVAGAITIGLMK